MDYNQNTAVETETPETPETVQASAVPETAPEAVKPTASTARRTITAILVLIAALLLGYVIYLFAF